MLRIKPEVWVIYSPFMPSLLMKKLLLPLALLLFASSAQAQKLAASQVYTAAKTTFKAKFPSVTNVTWEKEGSAYEAGFELNGKSMSALITPAGELLETETDMSAAELPAAVRATLARDYKEYKVKEAATIVKANGQTVYEAEVARGGKKADVLFTADGKVVTK